MKIAIDIMSGDLPSYSTLNGAVNYLNTYTDDELYLVGKKVFFKKNNAILGKIKNKNYKLIYAEDEIQNTDSVTRLFKKRPESPLIKTIQLLKDNKVDAIVSSGNTGALLSSSLMLLGKIEKIRRPALAAFIPTDKGGFVLCDVGANSDNKPIHLLQFSLMASAYIKYLEKIDNPKIALLNIGIEPNKGNSMIVESYKLLDKYMKNFIGNLESRYILDNKADIVICDGYTGNIVLKLIEGTVKKMINWTTESINNHSITKLAKPMLFPVFSDIKKNFDYEEHGGAPLLGVNGIVIKCHGSSNEKAIFNGLLHARRCVNNDFINRIKTSLDQLKIEEYE